MVGSALVATCSIRVTYCVASCLRTTGHEGVLVVEGATVASMDGSFWVIEAFRVSTLARTISLTVVFSIKEMSNVRRTAPRRSSVVGIFEN